VRSSNLSKRNSVLRILTNYSEKKRLLKFFDTRQGAVGLNRAISRCVTDLRVHSPVVDSPPSSSGRTTACTRIPSLSFI